jgi:hypothetical protein
VIGCASDAQTVPGFTQLHISYRHKTDKSEPTSCEDNALLHVGVDINKIYIF